MRNRPSRTAEGVLFFRALERLRPPTERALDDPYASWFLPRRLKTALAAASLAPTLAHRAQRRADPGVMPFVLARHRELDQRLERALSRGIEQLLILGAGYDSRAWRFAGALDGRPVFEVDHPATSARKARLAARHPDLPPVDLRQVPVDFRHDALKPRLNDAGFQLGRPTLILWEGVTMYLSEAEIGATLRAVREVVGPGSELVADFWSPTPSGPALQTLLRAGQKAAALFDEPFRSALDPSDAPQLFASHGWPVCGLIDADELARRHLPDGRKPLQRLYIAWLSTGTGSSRGGGSGKM